MSLRQVGKALGGKHETRIPLEREESSFLLKKYKTSEKKTFRGLMQEMKNKDKYFPQPIRTQPDMEMFYEHPEWSISKKMAKATSEDVKDWGPKIIADLKYDGCYSDDTEVLTIDGWKLFENVTMEDKIATLNQESHLVYNEPNAIIVEDFDGDLIHIENTSIDLMITPNHQLYTILLDKGGHKHGGYQFIRADRFEQGIFKKDAKWIGEDLSYKKIGEYEIPIEIWVEFMGYWLSEGSVYYSKVNHRYEICISQVKKKSREIMRVCLEKLTNVIGKRLNDYDDRFVFSDKILCQYLDNFGKAKDKYIPLDIKALNRDNLEVFLKAFSLGDGHERENYWHIYSTSERLIDDMQEIVLKVGYAGRKSLKFEEYIAPKNSKLYGLKCSKLYQLSIYRNDKKSRLETRIIPLHNKNQIVKRIHYVGKVYCVNVNNHVIYVRRNGKAIWCGNCRGLLYVNPKKKEVKIYSRRLKELSKLEKKYSDAILENISKLIKDETVFDVELYATDKNGKLLPYGIVAGWTRNPDPEKYKDLIPSIEIFDVVLMNQKDLRDMPLKFRKKMVELSLKKRDGKVLDVADTRLMRNHPRPIEWRFKAVIKGKGEGLVLKDPSSEYFYGKPKGKANPWRKLRMADTLDLEMKAVEVSPRGDKFKDYRHWIMVPRDDETHEIRANKGIKAAAFDDEFYRSFTLDMVNQWKLGYLAGQGKMIKVRKDLVDFYGVKEVPERLFYSKDRRMIVEVFTEKITEKIHPSGTKLVGIRFDKHMADKKEDIESLRKFFLGVSEK